MGTASCRERLLRHECVLPLDPQTQFRCQTVREAPGIHQIPGMHVDPVARGRRIVVNDDLGRHVSHAADVIVDQPVVSVRMLQRARPVEIPIPRSTGLQLVAPGEGALREVAEAAVYLPVVARPLVRNFVTARGESGTLD